MSRPTKYSQEMLDKAIEYMSGGWKKLEGHAFPSVLGLCHHLNIARSTAYKWADEEDKQFSDILEQCNELSEFVLANGGVKGDFNSTMTKLMLTKFGYSDKLDSTHAAPDGGPVQVSFVGVSSDGRRNTD